MLSSFRLYYWCSAVLVSVMIAFWWIHFLSKPKLKADRSSPPILSSASGQDRSSVIPFSFSSSVSMPLRAKLLSAASPVEINAAIEMIGSIGDDRTVAWLRQQYLDDSLDDEHLNGIVTVIGNLKNPYARPGLEALLREDLENAELIAAAFQGLLWMSRGDPSIPTTVRHGLVRSRLDQDLIVRVLRASPQILGKEEAQQFIGEVASDFAASAPYRQDAIVVKASVDALYRSLYPTQP